jgi:acetyl esterase/lipase
MVSNLNNRLLVGKLENSQTSPSPEMQCYLPEATKKNNIALIIFPGGAYHHLATHEGEGYAKFFSELGFSCFVVKYRLNPQGFKHPAMLEDALSAINVVRKNAHDLGIAPNKIGVMGSSAGGHLAAHAIVNQLTYQNSISLKPNFGILCYPVIFMDADKFCNLGSRINLIGENPTPSIVEEVTLINKVTPETPPCFLWHTSEDKAVPSENSILFAAELSKKKVPFELHIYQKGKHGLGINENLNWMTPCLRWLSELDFKI